MYQWDPKKTKRETQTCFKNLYQNVKTIIGQREKQSVSKALITNIIITKNARFQSARERCFIICIPII